MLEAFRLNSQYVGVISAQEKSGMELETSRRASWAGRRNEYLFGSQCKFHYMDCVPTYVEVLCYAQQLYCSLAECILAHPFLHSRHNRPPPDDDDGWTLLYIIYVYVVVCHAMLTRFFILPIFHISISPPTTTTTTAATTPIKLGMAWMELNWLFASCVCITTIKTLDANESDSGWNAEVLQSNWIKV